MKIKKIAAAAAALGMAVSMMAPISASADTVYTAIEGTKVTSFDKYLVMESDAVVPEASFSFTIAAGEAVPANDQGTTIPVLAGVGAPKFLLKTNTAETNDNEGTDTAAKVNFSPADTDNSAVTINEINMGIDKTVQFETSGNKNDEKYAQKKIAIDFTGVNFTEPGVYRYIITESEAADTQAAGVANDTQNTRVLDVVVVDSSAESTNKLSISNYLFHESAADTPVKGTGTAAGTATIASKSTGFTNKYKTYDLQFSKTVAGNQGSRDKYFKFDINITGAKGAEITVDREHFSTSPESSTTTSYEAADMTAANTVDQDTDRIGQQLKADADGNIQATFYIRHGQSVKLMGLPKNAKYTVTETQEDYTPSVSVTEATGGDAAAVTNNNGIADQSTGITGDTTAAFTNTRAGTIPTGLISTVAVSAGIVLLGAAGVIGGSVYLKKKKSEEE